MTIQNKFWKTLSLNMLFANQALFIASTAWDFFLTVVVSNSARSMIFSALPFGISVFIIVPWLVGIFILTGSLIIFALHKDYGPPVYKINFEYGGIMILYIVLFLLSMFTGAIRS